MPKIRRWFPVSHDINADPEVWEMRHTFGEWSLGVWLQILSVTDRNDGEMIGDRKWIEYSLTAVWRLNSKRYNTEWKRNKIGLLLDWMANKGWMDIESGLIRVRNYAKYHKTREPNKIPSGNYLGSLPSEPSEPSIPKKKENIIKERPSRKIPFPSDFSVTDSMRSWAREQRLPDPDSLFPAFKDHHISRGNKFIDWNAALRNWIRNDLKFSKNGKEPQKENELSERTQQILRRGL